LAIRSMSSRLAGYRQNLDGRVLFPHGANGFETLAVRHHDIGDEEIDGMLGQQRNGRWF
jgi:hypothetical protein